MQIKLLLSNIIQKYEKKGFLATYTLSRKQYIKVKYGNDYFHNASKINNRRNVSI